MSILNFTVSVINMYDMPVISTISFDFKIKYSELSVFYRDSCSFFIHTKRKPIEKITANLQKGCNR